MQALRLNEVLMRVVAWHNRHPLARRINASQVHSIGEVLLPFAASKPASASAMSPAASRLPDGADLPDPPQAAMPLLPGSMPSAASPATSAPDPASLASSLAAEGPGSASPEPAAESSPFTPAEADLAARLAADLNDAAHAPGEAADLALPFEPQATLAPQVTPTPALQAAPAATAGITPPSRPKRLLTWLTGRQPGLPRLQSTFSRDFIWPLSPGRVARWARGHGQLQPLAPADWPRRVVETDGTLLGAARQRGLTHEVELHVLTAAIGVGDRRLRVLMDGQGAVIGPRAYSRPRLAATGGVLALALLGMGWTTLRFGLPDGSAVLAAAAPAAAAASAATAAASSAGVAAVAEAAASAASSTALAAPADSAPSGTASNTLPADAAAPPSPEATAPAAHPAEAHAAGQATAGQAAAAATPPAAAAPPAPGPTTVTSAGHSAPLGRIRPTLSDEDKQAARAQTAALRDAKAEAPRAAAAATAPHTVYAIVTRPSPQREVASAGLVVMNRASSRLPPPVPQHGELMQNQGAWRAAWWPFASLADAERARVLLAGKGLKVEVVEF